MMSEGHVPDKYIEMEQLKDSQEVIHYQGAAAALTAKREAKIMRVYVN